MNVFNRWGFTKGGPIFSADHFPLVVTVAVIHWLWPLAAAIQPPFAAIIVQEEQSSKETRFSRKCAIYFPTYDKSDEIEDVLQNELLLAQKI